MKKITILYHANCPDGFSAAWAAWKKLKTKANYLPVEHQTPPPQGLEGKTLYMLDFTYSLEIIKELVKKNKKIVIIDHHTAAYRAIQKFWRFGLQNIEMIAENENSGAVLAWKYFHPKKPLPAIAKYVEDGDLWKFHLPNAKEIIAVIDDENHNSRIGRPLQKNWKNQKQGKKSSKREV